MFPSQEYVNFGRLYGEVVCVMSVEVRRCSVSSTVENAHVENSQAWKLFEKYIPRYASCF